MVSLMPLLATMLTLKRLGTATQRQLAAVTGKNQSTISRDLRQLTVSEKVARNDQNQPVKIYELALPKHKRHAIDP